MLNKSKLYDENWFFPLVKPSDAQGVNISAANFNIEDKQTYYEDSFIAVEFSDEEKNFRRAINF